MTVRDCDPTNSGTCENCGAAAEYDSEMILCKACEVPPAGRIAPHEGREIELVRDGDKPLAVIEKRKDPAQYGQILRHEGTDTLAIFLQVGPEGREAIVAKTPALIAEYLALVRDGITQLGIKGHHRAMGRLFGYSPEDVEAFIDAEIDCECSKCSPPRPAKYGSAINAARRTQFHAA